MSEPDGPPPLPAIEPAQAAEVIIGFIRAQMEQTGFERIVLGLSGGVDSATVAFLCARAVGPDNLLAVRMPYRTSSEASETDALRVVDRARLPDRAGRHHADGGSDAGARSISPTSRPRATCSTCGAGT